MRVATLIFSGLFASGAFAFAAADEPVDERVRLPVQTTADSDQAVPEWYQRFTFRDGVEARPVWTGANERDVELSWAKNDRWQLKLALTSRNEETGLPREEMSAGATFNITPRFSIGGALSLGADDFTPNGEWKEQELETGIRLQSAFKF